MITGARFQCYQFVSYRTASFDGGFEEGRRLEQRHQRLQTIVSEDPEA